MFNLTVHRITILFAALFYVMLGGDMLTSAAEEPNGLESVVRQAVIATGENYEAIRDRLVEQARQNREPFSHILKMTDDDRIKCICFIVLEYTDKDEEITKVRSLEPIYGYGRGTGLQLANAARVFARRYEAIPFYLLESFWKQNEMTKSIYHGGTRGDVACAIGHLDLERGRIPLEQVLFENEAVRPHAEDESWTIRGIMHGLILLNMRESIPAIVSFYEGNDNPEAKDVMLTALAISMIADVSYVEQLIPSIKDKSLKGELTQINKETKAAGFDYYRDLLIQQTKASSARQKSRGHTNPEGTAPNRVPE